MTTSARTDRIVVIGGGIAGVAAAYHLAATHPVTVVEAEPHLAHHSTGRSAALFFENYGAASIRPLSHASRSFFTHPSRDLAATPLARSRGALWIARQDQMDALTRVAEEGRSSGSVVEEITSDEACRRVPVLRPERLAGALWEPSPLDLDVAGAHQGFVRGLRRRGADIVTGARVVGLTRTGSRWKVEAGDTTLEAAVVVNAAGAWGDEVAIAAGVKPVGLRALRRTAFMVIGDEAWSDWPMVVDAGHEFYFKPDGSQLLCSPADETPVAPGDVRADPVDVALAIERINEATILGIRSVRSEWAGMRTFAPDGGMVIGPDPDQPTFVWLVGQGGTGIQTAPAAGELVAGLVGGQGLPDRLAELGVDLDRLGPGRFRTG